MENDVTALNAQMHEHGVLLGRAIERLDAYDAARQAFESSASTVNDLGARVSNLLESQQEVVSRLERLEAIPAVEGEAGAVEDALDPENPEHVNEPDPAPNTGAKSKGVLARIHGVMG